VNHRGSIKIILAGTPADLVIAGRLSICSSLSWLHEEEALTLLRAALRAAVVTAEAAVAEGRKAAAIAGVEIAEGRKVVAIAEADLAARHREEAIVAVIPEVVPHAAEETRRHQTAMDATTVNLLDAGWRPAFSPRSPSGGFGRSLLLSWRWWRKKRKPLEEEISR
jgi:hypothetical protein